MTLSKLLVSLGILMSTRDADAQFKLPINNAFRSDVQKIVSDYPHQFAAFRGAVVNKNPQSVEYASLLVPNGTEASSITGYSAIDKPIYSWQAVLLTTENFEEAQKKYKWLFNQLKGLNVHYVADQYTLRGVYEAPDESRKFTTSVLTVHAPPTPLKKLKVEATMEFEFPEWKVRLLVYEKEREDTDPGDVQEQ